MAKFRAHLANGDIALIEDTAQSAGSLLQDSGPFRATQIVRANGEDAGIALVWVNHSAILWVEQIE